MDFSGAIPVTRDKGIDKGRPFLAHLLAEFPNTPSASNPKPSGAAAGDDPTILSTVSPLYSAEPPAELDVIPPVIVHCMATCHNVAIYGDNKFVGQHAQLILVCLSVAPLTHLIWTTQEMRSK